MFDLGAVLQGQHALSYLFAFEGFELCFRDR